MLFAFNVTLPLPTSPSLENLIPSFVHSIVTVFTLVRNANDTICRVFTGIANGLKIANNFSETCRRHSHDSVVACVRDTKVFTVNIHQFQIIFTDLVAF